MTVRALGGILLLGALTVAPACATRIGIDSESHFACKADIECAPLGSTAQCVAGRCEDPIPPLPAAVVWSPCTEDFLNDTECATLKAPLDYADPGGDTIEIALSRVPASDPTRRIGSLLLNGGGEGGPTRVIVTTVRDLVATNGPFIWSYPATPEVRARFDLIGFDQRGVGASTPAKDCGDSRTLHAADYTPDDDVERRALEGTMREYAAACAANNGRILEYMDSYSAARDMDQIRKALGEEQISYYGDGWGTRLGTVYADLFPDHVRAMVLDSAIRPGLDVRSYVREQALGVERGFEAFASDCDGRTNCTSRFVGGDIRAAFDQAVAQLEANPLVAPDGEVFTESQFVMMIAGNLDVPTTTGPLLEGTIEAALAGNAGTLAAFFKLVSNSAASATATQINCADLGFPDPSLAYTDFLSEVLAAAPRFGQSRLRYWLPCAHWPTKPRPHTLLHAKGGPPIVVIGGSGDDNVPYEWSESLARSLDSGVLITRNGVGHVNYDACTVEQTSAYLVDLTVPADGTVCP